MCSSTKHADSHKQLGGLIPGTSGVHAYCLTKTEPSAVPILIAVPHAGRAYSGSILRELRQPEVTALKLEDRLVDQVAARVAETVGAPLLVANAPRAMIDLNRAPDDIDWEMFGGKGRTQTGGYSPGRRARTGLGLIPRRVPGIGELWKKRHQEAELTARIKGIHEPYHACLSRELQDLRERWGAALLIDLHSMPPIKPRAGIGAPEFVVGDRFGTACHGRLVAASFSHFNECRRLAAHNRPYAGGYVLERHADPRAGINAMQIEIDRSVYLDSDLAQLGNGFEGTVEVLSRLIRSLSTHVCELGDEGKGQTWSEAAE